MTPMSLEKAMEVAIRGLESHTLELDTMREAAAVLREFMEKGLPFYRAAEIHAKNRNHEGLHYEQYGCDCCCSNEEALVDAYRAMKEAK